MGMFDRFFERKPQHDRIVGGNRKERKDAKTLLDKRFRDQDRFEQFKKYEVEKNKIELRAIREANHATNLLREKYGLPELLVPESNIHLLEDTNEVREQLGHSQAAGSYQPEEKAVFIVNSSSPAETFHTVFHEMTHFKSYSSFEPEGEGGGAIRERRLGLTVNPEDDDRAFVPLNEGVTETLAMNYMRSMGMDYMLEAETKNIADAREFLEQEEAHDAYAMTRTGEIIKFGYAQERQALDLLIDKIVQRNLNTPLNKKEVFEMFASAMFNGHLLELARMIEGAFGKGKFRELGEQKTGEEMLKFVESL